MNERDESNYPEYVDELAGYAVSCRGISDSLSAYLDDECEKNERQSIEFHLHDCLTCRQILSDLRMSRSALNQLRNQFAPSPVSEIDIADKVQHAIQGQELDHACEACGLDKTLISAYADGELVEERRSEVSTCIEQCQSCSEEHAKIESLKIAMSSLSPAFIETVALSEIDNYRLLESTEKAILGRQLDSSSKLIGLDHRKLIAVAACFMLLLSSGILWFSNQQDSELNLGSLKLASNSATELKTRSYADNASGASGRSSLDEDDLGDLEIDTSIRSLDAPNLAQSQTEESVVSSLDADDLIAYAPPYFDDFLFDELDVSEEDGLYAIKL